MSKLYGISCDEKKWSIKGSRARGYTIESKVSFDSYTFVGDIIGIEQVAENSFLIHERILRDERALYAIERLRLENGKKIQEFYKTFNNFEFISEDLILFINDFTLYSIEKNCEIDAIQHIISSTKPDSIFYNSMSVELPYDNDEASYPSYLVIEYELSSYYTKEFIQVIVEIDTLKPVKKIYSTLRGEYLNLTNEVTLEKIFIEHNKEINIIDNFFRELHRKKLHEFCDMVLNS